MSAAGHFLMLTANQESSMPDARPAHKRILLKLSGEALMGDDQFGINRTTIVRMVDEIA